MFCANRIKDPVLFGKKEVVPKSYLSEIYNGRMSAIEVLDDDRLYGIALFEVTDDWLEIVWTYIFEPDVAVNDRALFLKFCINEGKAIRREGLKGAYIELPLDEAGEDEEEVLALAGMEVIKSQGNVAMLTLGDVADPKRLLEAADKAQCVRLSDSRAEWLDRLSIMMNLDERPVPAQVYMDWSRYLQDLSFVGMKKGSPAGCILMSEEQDALVLDLAYASDPVLLPVMLGNAYRAIDEKYGQDKVILVPAVISKTKELVDRIAPTAEWGEVLEGFMRFGERRNA